MKPQLQRLEEILKLLNDGVSKKDFVAAFEAALKQIQALERRLLEKYHRSLAELRLMEAQLRNSNEAELETIKQRAKSSLEVALKEQENSLNFIRDKVRKLENGRDGKDGHTPTDAELLTLIYPLIPKPIEPKSAKLKITDIEGLDQFISDRIPKRYGGGHTDMGVTYTIGRIVKKETPSGVINGTNTQYTLTQPIHAVISLVINGQMITDDEFTVAGNKIILTTALPAGLSGTSFRCVYV